LVHDDRAREYLIEDVHVSEGMILQIDVNLVPSRERIKQVEGE
jgi:hypothetical protein